MTEKCRFSCANSGGRGGSAEEAVQDSKNNATAVSKQTGIHPAIVAVTSKASTLVGNSPAKPAQLGVAPPETYHKGIAATALSAAGGVVRSIAGSVARQGAEVASRYLPSVIDAAKTAGGEFIGSITESASASVTSILESIGESLLAFLAL
jgi:hypothetical protein